MYKRVLFCIPPLPNRYGFPAHPHTGIGYLCENLKANGIETAVIDFRFGNGYEELDKKLKTFKPELFGVTVMSYYHNLAYDIAARLKNYGLPVVIGGPHVSTLRGQAIKECSADFGFVMEAERSLLSFCRGEPMELIPGLLYRRNGEIIENPPGIIPDLDNIPFPRHQDVILSRYTRKRIAIVTSRGCPCQCTFCPISTVIGRKYRLRCAENVFLELKYWYEQGYRDFDFEDDNFIVDKERVFKLFDMIKEADYNDLFMQCGNGIRADLATEELLERMKQAGFKSVAFGVESANPQVLKNVKKGETFTEIENAVRLAVEVGLDVSLFFIVGLPGETPRTFKESINFALKYPVSTATFYNLIPFPGTELFDWVKNNNYFIIRPEDYLNTVAHLEHVPVFQTTDFTAQERKIALKQGAKINNIIKRKDMQRKLGNNLCIYILAWLVYESFLNKVIFGLIKVTFLKKLMNFILLKLKIRINL